MPQAQAPKRDATWDIARGIGMMLVIYGHLLEPMYPAHNGRALIQMAADQWQVIYSFHMMLFFLVSGAVNRNSDEKGLSGGSARLAEAARSGLGRAYSWRISLILQFSLSYGARSGLRLGLSSTRYLKAINGRSAFCGFSHRYASCRSWLTYRYGASRRLPLYSLPWRRPRRPAFCQSSI